MATPKRLIICSDGTWKSADDREVTNVARIARAIAPVDAAGTPQLCRYDPGVGTGHLLDRLLGGVTGSGIRENVRQLYGFLAEHYEPGDEVYAFGFSHGAYTVRSTVGFIRKCGLLRPDRLDWLDEAWALYTRRDASADTADAIAFRAAHSRELERIRFLGVWDTVGALGVPYGRLRRWSARLHEFHDVRLSRRVEHAYHAVAIDERRTPFVPTLWEDEPLAERRVEQTWFVGTHSNVGGGYGGGTQLSSLALEWMAERAAGCGLAFTPGALERELDGSFRGSLGRSSRLYRLLRLDGPPRPIGLGAPLSERVHTTAWQRLDEATRGYAPQNLSDYSARGGRRSGG